MKSKNIYVICALRVADIWGQPIPPENQYWEYLGRDNTGHYTLDSRRFAIEFSSVEEAEKNWNPNQMSDLCRYDPESICICEEVAKYFICKSLTT